MLRSAQEVLMELEKRRQEFAKAVLTDDRSVSANNVKLTWQEATMLYGDVRMPLAASLAVVNATGITDTWRDLKHAAGTSIVGTEAGAGNERQKAIPTGHTNTCQIFDAKISVSGSAAEAARRGLYGPETDEVAFQTQYNMNYLLACMEWQALYGLEVTETGATETHQRKFKGLVGTIGAWNGMIQTQVHAVTDMVSGQDHLDEAALDAFIAHLVSGGCGMIDTFGCSALTVTRFKALNTKVSFNYTLADLERLISQGGLPIGTPVAIYWSAFGPIKVVYMPLIPDDASVIANNFLIAYNSENVKWADWRDLRADPLAKTADSEDKLLIAERSLRLYAEPHAGILHTFSPTASS